MRRTTSDRRWRCLDERDRAIVLDTTIPAQGTGELDDQDLAWLDAELAGSVPTPTLLAMHHPPLLTGSPEWDRVALSERSCQRLSQTLKDCPHVRQILGAHLHRPLLARTEGYTLVVAPSTYAQFPFQTIPGELGPSNEPPGYVVHQIAEDGAITSYFQAVIQAPAGRSN